MAKGPTKQSPVANHTVYLGGKVFHKGEVVSGEPDAIKELIADGAVSLGDAGEAPLADGATASEDAPAA